MSRIFGSVEMMCNVPDNTRIDTTANRVLFKLIDDMVVPIGDAVTIDNPSRVHKVKLLELHARTDGSPFDTFKGPVFVERHCIRHGGQLYPYMLNVIRKQHMSMSTFIMPWHIQFVKEQLLGMPRKDHETLATCYVDTILSSGILDDIYARDIFESFTDEHANLIMGISPADDRYADFLSTCTNTFTECMENIHWHRYGDEILERALYPNIGGLYNIDTLTARALKRPLTIPEICLHTEKQWVIDMHPADSVQLDPSAPCIYMNPKDSIMAELLKILKHTAITDLDLRYILSDRWFELDVKYAYSRYPIPQSKNDILDHVINNIGRLLHVDAAKGGISSVRVMKTFNDEVVFYFYRNKTLVCQWYCDLSIMMLCSDNLIVWS